MSSFVVTTRKSNNLFDIFKTKGLDLSNDRTFTVSVNARDSSGATTNYLKDFLPDVKDGDIVYFNYDCDYSDWEGLRIGIPTRVRKNIPITITDSLLGEPLRFYRITSGTIVEIEIKNLMVSKTPIEKYEPYGIISSNHIITTTNSGIKKHLVGGVDNG